MNVVALERIARRLLPMALEGAGNHPLAVRFGAGPAMPARHAMLDEAKRAEEPG
jgi:hypothetical protein